MTVEADLFEPRLARRRRWGALFHALCVVLTLLCIGVLLILLTAIALEGGKWLSWKLLQNFPSRLMPENAGLKSALYGTMWLMVLTAVVSVPVGVSAAVYLHEYAGRNRWTRFIELNIANLAGVPSIVYGILGLAVFVRIFQLGRSLIAGALTLTLLILPVVIVASREALAAVPDSIRKGAYALGATRWQTVRSHVLPAALPGILTGIILALSRAIGEAAPLLILGALTYITFVPQGLTDAFTALPIQIYNWADEPEKIFQELAAAGILVLLGLLLPLNGIAVAIRAWHQRRKVW
ncbi:MAG: phosphate ABC transporter permease PstA [Planctomycetota bacterium]|nr:MAG: phosphate ABC transporter permease PstA [Planctomycetota bacterium]